jgi:excisionase family DNA binding protein
MKIDEIAQRLERIENLLESQSVKPMNLTEAAGYLSISKAHLYKLTSQSLIPHFKPNGKKIVFLKADLDAYLLRNRVALRARPLQ